MSWCKEQSSPLPYFETSAKDSIGVDKVFLAAARSAMSKIPEDTP